MKISIFTNLETTDLFDPFIQEFSFAFTNIYDTFLINKNIKEKHIIKNSNNKKLTLYPYENFFNDEIKINKNIFYIFSNGFFKESNQINESDVILLFVNLEKLNENSLFNLIRKIKKYKIDVKKTIFIPWCKEKNYESKLNLIILERTIKNKLFEEIIELNNYQDKKNINLIIDKIRNM